MIGISIDSVDRTGDIEQNSVRYDQTKSKKPATLSFSILGANKSIPDRGDAVLMTLDGSNFFRGSITDRQDVSFGPSHERYLFTCEGGFYDLDRKLVIKTYSSTDAGAIVTDIVTNFGSGISVNVMGTPPNITTARFNYEEPSQAIKKIADEIGWDWYIDAENVLHFFEPSTQNAPVGVEDDNGSHINRSLKMNSNLTELKNIVFVRGGEYEDPVTEADAYDKYEANGVDNTFPLVYRYGNVQVTVNGLAQTVGIDFLDDPLLFDCLYNFQEKLVRFPDGTLAESDVVAVFGNRKVPVIVQAQDTASINQYGEREYVEIDRTINSIEQAEQVALALLDQWNDGSREGSFETYRTDFRVGQTVRINSPRFNIDETFIINRVKAKMRDHEGFVFTIEFLKSGQTTFQDLMIDLIGRDKKNITIADNEVVQRLISVSDQFGWDDEVTQFVTRSGPYYWTDPAGDPSPGSEAFIWNESTWS